MRAVSTSDMVCFHLLLGDWIMDFDHACALPGVFTGCKEEDMPAGYVESAVSLIRLFNIRRGEVRGEGLLALGNPPLIS